MGVKCFADLGFWVLFLWCAFDFEVRIIGNFIVVNFLFVFNN